MQNNPEAPTTESSAGQVKPWVGRQGAQERGSLFQKMMRTQMSWKGSWTSESDRDLGEFPRHHLTAVQLWATCRTSLSLNFPIFKMGIIIHPLHRCCEDETTWCV